MRKNQINIYSKVSIQDALNINNATWIDVRCPREFLKGHFADAINIPIFSNSEYEKLGTLYRHKGQAPAIKLGEEYANQSTKKILSKISEINNQNFIVYCARGGMRSKGMQEILNQSGYLSHRIDRGYKAIRNYTLSTFTEKRDVIILAGSTGTGKTQILQEMKGQGSNVIDLEAIANHRGSAFGDLGLNEQPTQQQFENNLSMEWIDTDPTSPVFIESESRKIGRVVIPEDIWSQMGSGHYLKIKMGIDRRIKNLLKEYGDHKKNDLKKRVDRISTRLGGAEAKEAINFLDRADLSSFCRLLLKKYYDTMYEKAYDMRESSKDIIEIQNQTNTQIIKIIHELI